MRKKSRRWFAGGRIRGGGGGGEEWERAGRRRRRKLAWTRRREAEEQGAEVGRTTEWTQEELSTTGGKFSMNCKLVRFKHNPPQNVVNSASEWSQHSAQTLVLVLVQVLVLCLLSVTLCIWSKVHFPSSSSQQSAEQNLEVSQSSWSTGEISDPSEQNLMWLWVFILYY